MANENYKAWLDYLSTTDLPQVQGRLVVRDEVGHVGYCCLGVACTLAPEGEQWLDGYYTMLPASVARWMGLDEDVEVGPDGTTFEDLEEGEASLDIRVDHTFVIPDADNEDAFHYDELTAASMNDEGFTFAQIADVFRYFGAKLVP